MAAESTALPAMPALSASLRPLLLLIGIAAAVAAGVWIVLWSRGPTYSLLYANLSPQQEAQIVQALQGAQIPYRLDSATNGVEVPAEQLDAARLKLAGQGVAGGDSFSEFDKSSSFGVSQFMENIRYQHLLESELAHTIASMQEVESARVHLAVPRQSVFVSDRTPASASVFVQLRAGGTLGPGQVQAIVNLVASSVPDLSASRVTVVDQNGQLLSSPQGNSAYALDEQNYNLVHRLESQDRRRIVELLTPLVGPGLVRADVVAELTTDTSEQAEELYKPGSQIVRSEQISEQSSGSGRGGVPGSLSNEPPTPGSLAPPVKAPAKGTAAGSGAAPASASSSQPASGAQPNAAPGTPSGAKAAVEPVGAPGAGGHLVSSNVTRNYEIDRTLNYSRRPPGQIRRLSVAVLIGYHPVKGPKGKVTDVPLSAQELARVTQLVKDAVGFDAARGDSVSVVNEPLDLPAAAPAGGQLAEPSLWQRPLFWSLVKIGAGLVAVLALALVVLRPMVRMLLTPVQRGASAPAQLEVDAEDASMPQAQKEAVVKALSHEQQLANARALVSQDPKRVAQMVRGWVGTDE